MFKRFLIFCLSFCLLSCHHKGSLYNGYIDVDLTYLSSNYAGRLASLWVKRGETVRSHQALFHVSQTNEQFDVAKSQLTHKALLAERQALISQIHYAEINYQRVLGMRKEHAASQEDLDKASRDLAVFQDQLQTIDLQIKSSQVSTLSKQWIVDQKENFAPDEGIIFDTYFTHGEYVQAGQPIVSLITKHNIKVIFFVPEKDLSRIALNQRLHMTSDGNLNLGEATISYISKVAQYTPPIIYSREERQNLVFRVEARLANPHLDQLHLGEPVSLELIA